MYKVLYYDDYDVDNNGSLGTGETYTDPAEAGYETAAFLRTRGKPTVAKVAILKNDNTAPSTYLTTRTYYDKEYSVIQVNKQNHLSGADISSTAYDFANRITKTRRDHTATPPGGSATTHTIRENYTYDAAGRVTYVYHQINNQTKVLLSKSTYDELDRLQEKNLHCSNFNGSALPLPQNYLQSIDYSYNIRGWLTGINDPTTCTTQNGDNLGDMFKMSLTYESTATGGTAQYNGNISSAQWNISSNTTTCSTRNLYRFSYDGANRLTAADYLTWSGAAWTTSNNYTESNITYDLNGNIKTYNRRGLVSGTSTFGVIDQLTYTYGDALRPDRLTQMADAGSDKKGFKPSTGLTGDHYLYDANGNMTQDKHKGFTIAYNYMNLPVTFTNGTNIITMTYTADGDKLTKAVTGGGATRNYLNGIEYSGAALEAIYHKEGRLTPNGSNFFYEYTLKDHLGNARINFRANGTAVTFLEEHHYYPFGMKMEGIGTTPIVNKYMYNNKELNDDFGLNLSDYGARWYDGVLGRWGNVDILSEKCSNMSPYNYAKNDPIKNIDVGGGFAISVHYAMTKGTLSRLGYSSATSDLVGHYASTYADNPAGEKWYGKILAWSQGQSYRNDIDYSGTKHSQNTASIENSTWHGMKADNENIDNENAMRRGQEFGWNKIFEAADAAKTVGGIENLEKNSSGMKALGQGLHALQDANAHKGTDMKNHSVPKDIGPGHPDYNRASETTESAIIGTEILSGKYDNLNNGMTFTFDGMNTNQLTKMISSLLDGMSSKGVNYVMIRMGENTEFLQGNQKKN